jgi:hypothetical protein
VLVSLYLGRIQTKYQGDQLVNGDASYYSEALLKQAIELTRRFAFPWFIRADGTQQITDHQRYYEHTFNPHLQGIDLLKQWVENHGMDET